MNSRKRFEQYILTKFPLIGSMLLESNDAKTERDWEVWQAAETALSDKWISVDEGLPEDGARVLVWIGEPAACTPGNEIGIATANITTEEDEFAVAPVVFSFARAGFLGGNEVTHWQPLPLPPSSKEPI